MGNTSCLRYTLAVNPTPILLGTEGWPKEVVEIRPANKIVFELDGPSRFESVEATVRGMFWSLIR
jgi:hypothetical protein